MVRKLTVNANEITAYYLETNKLIIEGNDDLTVSDGYHTMNELYEHRMCLNAALFNLIEQVSHWESSADTLFDNDYKVMKSKHHFDGTIFEGYFIVMALTLDGQISYHYDLKYWNLFEIPEVDKIPFEYDGHTSNDVLERLLKL